MDVELSHKIVSVAELAGTLDHHDLWRSISNILSGHDDRAWHVAWNPAKPLLATCSADKSVRLYTYTADPSPTFSFYTSIPTGHTKTVRAVAWSPSGSTLATASFDANIGIWKREGKDEDDGGGGGEAAGEWECVSILEGHETECKSVAWSGSGTLLASCSRDKTVWVWEGACHFRVVRVDRI
jgi:WD40 repeat protein